MRLGTRLRCDDAGERRWGTHTGRAEAVARLRGSRGRWAAGRGSRPSGGPPRVPPCPALWLTHAQFDVREDSEQDVKLKAILELLLAAGYFRARIKGLSPFDKVWSELWG